MHREDISTLFHDDRGEGGRELAKLLIQAQDALDNISALSARKYPAESHIRHHIESLQGLTSRLQEQADAVVAHQLAKV